MVNVIGTFTLERTFPGVNRQRRNALTVALSKIGFPILWAIVRRSRCRWPDRRLKRNTASGNMTATRFVRVFRFAGRKSPIAFAPVIDIVPGRPAWAL